MKEKYEKQVTLKNGLIATIRLMRIIDDTTALQKYLNDLVDEDTFIVIDKKISLEEEKKWQKGQVEAFKKKEGHHLLAFIDGKLAGTTAAERERGKGRHTVQLGLSVTKKYRGIGLGEALLRTNIELVKKRLKPKIIYLRVFAPNKTACKLYEKVGFREFAVFPKSLRYRGKFVDHVYMKLEDKSKAETSYNEPRK